MGIGTETPDESAILEVSSVEKGFLPPRMDTSERNNILNPAEGLVIFNTDENCLQFYNSTGWYNSCDGAITGLPIDNGGVCDGEASIFTFEGVQYKPIESSGNCWLDRNLGASQVASASDDEDAYGYLYQWGRASDGHQVRNSPTYDVELNGDGVANFNSPGGPWDGQFILRNNGANNWVNPSVSNVDNLWQGENGVNNPCPTNYRLPTEAEWVAERGTWGSINAAGAFDSPLKLTVAGRASRFSGSPFSDGSSGYYWASNVDGTSSKNFVLLSTGATIGTSFRALGYSVRCIKD